MATVQPTDILITSDRVLHVTAATTTTTLTGSTTTITANTAEGKTITGTINPNDSFRHIPNVTEIEAETYFDIERRRDAIYSAVATYGLGGAPRAYRNHWSDTPRINKPDTPFSILNPESAEPTLAYLSNAEKDLTDAHQWVTMKRDEYLEALHKMLTTHNTKPTYTAPIDTNEKVTIKKRTFWVGYIYKLTFRTPEAGYMSRITYARVDRVTKTKAYATFGNTKTGYITTNPGDSWYSLKAVVDGKEYYIQGWADALPTGSFQEIETYRKNRANQIVPENELKNIYLETFATGVRPSCLNSRYFIEKEVGHWWGTYEERRAKSLDEIYKMLFDIEKSLHHIQWVRSQIADFYKDAQ